MNVKNRAHRYSIEIHKLVWYKQQSTLYIIGDYNFDICECDRLCKRGASSVTTSALRSFSHFLCLIRVCFTVFWSLYHFRSFTQFLLFYISTTVRSPSRLHIHSMGSKYAMCSVFTLVHFGLANKSFTMTIKYNFMYDFVTFLCFFIFEWICYLYSFLVAFYISL